MKVLIIFNDDVQSTDEIDNSFLCLESRKSIVNVALEVAKALHAAEFYHNEIAPIRSLSDIEEAIRIHDPNLVFNLCESLHGDASFEIAVAEKLEEIGVPFTGNGSRALAFALDKFACNQRLADLDIPVPKSFMIETMGELEGIELAAGKYIVKPNNEDGSTGIDESSVVENLFELEAKINDLLSHGPRRLIVQEFIEGREINFAFLGQVENIHWCTSEILFDPAYTAKNNILCYASKWAPDSDHFKRSKSAPCILEEELKDRLTRIVAQASEALGISSYARIDFRINEQGQPYIIDVNPNCDLDPNAGMTRANQFIGIPYEQLVRAIALRALEHV